MSFVHSPSVIFNSKMSIATEGILAGEKQAKEIQVKAEKKAAKIIMDAEKKAAEVINTAKKDVETHNKEVSSAATEIAKGNEEKSFQEIVKKVEDEKKSAASKKSAVVDETYSRLLAGEI